MNIQSFLSLESLVTASDGTGELLFLVVRQEVALQIVALVKPKITLFVLVL